MLDDSARDSRSGKKLFWLLLADKGDDAVDEGLGSLKCSKMTETSGRRRYEKFEGVGRENERVLGAERSVLGALDADSPDLGWIEGCRSTAISACGGRRDIRFSALE